MSKYTKGPWVVAATHSQVEVVNQYPREGAVWELQATASTPANARLIAAAPELLEALKVLIQDTDCGCEDSSDRGPYHCNHCKALGVLAKAEGEK